jgi:hypothetical protein
VRLARFAGVVALVVLTGRQLAYALAPAAPLESLPNAVGGPGLVVTTLVVMPVALALACALLWLCALGVRERHLLGDERVVVPRLRPVRIVGDAVALAVASVFLFAALESWVHWRAGMGFHGLHCLSGPSHRNAIPILCALALLSAAARAALRHVLAWMRRTLVLLRPRARDLPRVPVIDGAADVAFSSLLPSRIRVRGPPCAPVPG